MWWAFYGDIQAHPTTFKNQLYAEQREGDAKVSTLVDIFGKFKIALYQNESFDLDHFYPEPYQDEGDEIKEIGEPFETDKSRTKRTRLAESLMLDVVTYKFNPEKGNIPINSAIATSNKLMHDMEIDILRRMVASGEIAPDVNVSDRMLIVDGPLQFIVQDDGKPEFADLFYNVVGVSKSFNPMLPTSDKAKRGGTQIGSELLNLGYGDRTPVFLKKNDRGRKFGCWYLRIRPMNLMSNPLEGIIKIEKMATEDDKNKNGLSNAVVDNISLSLLNEGSSTCYGRDKRWAAHLYPVYLTETLVKSTFESDLVFISKFRCNCR